MALKDRVVPDQGPKGLIGQHEGQQVFLGSYREQGQLALQQAERAKGVALPPHVDEKLFPALPGQGHPHRTVHDDVEILGGIFACLDDHLTTGKVGQIHQAHHPLQFSLLHGVEGDHRLQKILYAGQREIAHATSPQAG